MAWYVLSVSLHILAACVWIGGMVFLAAAVLPLLRRPAYQALALPLIHALGLRFRWIGWAALATLVGTGITNLSYRGYGWDQVRTGTVWQGWFGYTLAVKLVLVALILVIGAAHDIVIGPLATRQETDNPDSPRIRRLRRRAAWVGRVMLLLSVIVVILGVMLVRGLP